MARARDRLTPAQYNETPPDLLPAMDDVDAISLYQDFIRQNTTAPAEVMVAANAQANEIAPPGFTATLEEYHGRLRVHMTRKSERGI